MTLFPAANGRYKRRDSSRAVGFPSRRPLNKLSNNTLKYKQLADVRTRTHTPAHAHTTMIDYLDQGFDTPKRTWPETVKLVRERAQNCCERCKKPEGLCIKYNNKWQTMRLNCYHLDYNPNNNDLSNLVLLCPICALTFKAQAQRAREAREQRLKDAQLTLDFQ